MTQDSIGGNHGTRNRVVGGDLDDVAGSVSSIADRDRGCNTFRNHFQGVQVEINMIKRSHQEDCPPDPSDLYKARLEQSYDEEDELLEEESEDG